MPVAISPLQGSSALLTPPKSPHRPLSTSTATTSRSSRPIVDRATSAMSTASPPRPSATEPFRRASGDVAALASSGPRDIPRRRPSPWHDIAHSLSSTSLSHSMSCADEGPGRRRVSSGGSSPRIRDRGCRRSSHGTMTPTRSFRPESLELRAARRKGSASAPSGSHRSSPKGALGTPPENIYLLPTPPQSSYYLSAQVATPSTKPHISLSSGITTPEGSTVPLGQARPLLGRPRLSAERDHAGHIEYKLKLINPSPDRFERLVTQMVWRLKEGRGEAIYEIGLADDGTVVGLSRDDMDASIRTLELMAEEIGATVIILKEIILAGSGQTGPSRTGFEPPRPSSGPGSGSGSGPRTGSTLGTTESSALGKVEQGHRAKLSASARRRAARSSRGMRWVKQPRVDVMKEKMLIFDPDDLAAGEEGRSSDEEHNWTSSHPLDTTTRLESAPNSVDPQRNDAQAVVADDGVFALDTASTSRPGAQSLPDPVPSAGRQSALTFELPRNGSLTKAWKAERRRQARRLDLLKGDGKGPIWVPGVGLPAQSPDLLPMQGQQGQQVIDAAEEDEDDGSLIEEISHEPLDTLSTSFADIRLIPPVGGDAETGSNKSNRSRSSSDASSSSSFTPSQYNRSCRVPASMASSATSTSASLSISPSVSSARGSTTLLNGLELENEGSNNVTDDRRDGSHSKASLQPHSSDLVCIEALIVRKSVHGYPMPSSLSKQDTGDIEVDVSDNDNDNDNEDGDESEHQHRHSSQRRDDKAAEGLRRGRSDVDGEESEQSEYGGADDGWGLGGGDWGD